MLKSPLTIYVVFHPESAECRALADHLHDWFRLKQDDGDGTEAGLPIWYRAEVSSEGRLSPEIAWHEASINAVVVLASDLMVADPAWRAALAELCRDPTRLILPVPVDPSAFRLGFMFGARNRLPAGAFADPGKAESPTERTARIERRARVLRRGLTEAVTRELQRLSSDGTPPTLQVFVSHAKADGGPIAAALRDGLAAFGQLKTWFDENDLPPSYSWAPPIEKAVTDGCAALISVVTDAYPTRYWCRRELNLARTPTSIPLHGATSVTAWTTQPAVAVLASGRRWSRGMAQLAQVPQIGWSDVSGSEAASRVEDVVDRLLLETLLVSFYRRFADTVAEAYEASQPAHRLALVTWVPDPWTLTHLMHELQRLGPNDTWTIAYPGHGLRTAEIDELTSILHTPGTPIGGSARAKLVSQERLYEPRGEVPAGLTVALSAGGVDADVYAAGVGMKHINDAMVRVTRRLLEAGVGIIYGGTLGRPGEELTEALIECARGWDGVQSNTAPATIDALAAPPLLNYTVWPSAAVSLRRRAELTGICGFVEVGFDQAPAHFDARDPAHQRRAADALSEMRHHVAERTAVRVVFAGKVTDWAGWMPGVVEEVASSLAVTKLPFVLGGFGGCGGLLARYLSDASADWPAALSYERAKLQARFQLLLQSAEAESEAQKRWRHAQALIADYRRHLHSAEPWAYAGSRALARDALAVSSPVVAVRYIMQVLQSLTAISVR